MSVIIVVQSYSISIRHGSSQSNQKYEIQHPIIPTVTPRIGSPPAVDSKEIGKSNIQKQRHQHQGQFKQQYEANLTLSQVTRGVNHRSLNRIQNQIQYQSQVSDNHSSPDPNSDSISNPTSTQNLSKSGIFSPRQPQIPACLLTPRAMELTRQKTRSESSSSGLKMAISLGPTRSESNKNRQNSSICAKYNSPQQQRYDANLLQPETKLQYSTYEVPPKSKQSKAKQYFISSTAKYANLKDTNRQTSQNIEDFTDITKVAESSGAQDPVDQNLRSFKSVSYQPDSEGYGKRSQSATPSYPIRQSSGGFTEQPSRQQLTSKSQTCASNKFSNGPHKFHNRDELRPGPRVRPPKSSISSAGSVKSTKANRDPSLCSRSLMARISDETGSGFRTSMSQCSRSPSPRIHAWAQHQEHSEDQSSLKQLKLLLEIQKSYEIQLKELRNSSKESDVSMSSSLNQQISQKANSRSQSCRKASKESVKSESRRYTNNSFSSLSFNLNDSFDNIDESVRGTIDQSIMLDNGASQTKNNYQTRLAAALEGQSVSDYNHTLASLSYSSQAKETGLNTERSDIDTSTSIISQQQSQGQADVPGNLLRSNQQQILKTKTYLDLYEIQGQSHLSQQKQYQEFPAYDNKAKLDSNSEANKQNFNINISDYNRQKVKELHQVVDDHKVKLSGSLSASTSSPTQTTKPQSQSGSIRSTSAGVYSMSSTLPDNDSSNPPGPLRAGSFKCLNSQYQQDFDSILIVVSEPKTQSPQQPRVKSKVKVSPPCKPQNQTQNGPLTQGYPSDITVSDGDSEEAWCPNINYFNSKFAPNFRVKANSNLVKKFKKIDNDCINSGSDSKQSFKKQDVDSTDMKEVRDSEDSQVKVTDATTLVSTDIVTSRFRSDGSNESSVTLNPANLNLLTIDHEYYHCHPTSQIMLDAMCVTPRSYCID